MRIGHNEAGYMLAPKSHQKPLSPLPLLALGMVLLAGFSCTYAERKWNQKMTEFNQRIDQKMLPAEGKAGRCQAKGGVFYNEKCYKPDSNLAVRGEQTCRLHGGLYINDECLTDQRSGVHFQ